MLNAWLEGRHESWWVAEDDGALCGAVRAVRERVRIPDRLELLVREPHVSRLGRMLAARGLASLGRSRRRLAQATLQGQVAPLAAEMEALGFQVSEELVQMRLNLGRAPLVAGS
jgi:hypothetical protein